MELTLTSTTKVVELNGVRTRIWEGKTKNGVRVHAYVALVAHDLNEHPDNIQEFWSDLEVHRAPSQAIEIIPSRLIL